MSSITGFTIEALLGNDTTATDDGPRYRPSRVQALYPRAVAQSSWLVSKHGVALFVTESEEFMTWFIKANPGAVMEEVTGHVPEALARTAR